MSQPDETSLKSHGSSHTSKASHTSKRGYAHAIEEALKRKKEKDAHPERRLLFKPKVYEFWRDEDIDDEIADRERLIQEISVRELDIKKKKEEGDYNSDEDDDEEDLAAQKAALERLKSRRHREEVYKTRLEEELIREEKQKALEYEEKLLSELQNPSKYGWFYTDGYYDNAVFFGVKDSYLEKMVEQQETWKEKWTVNHPETFTEKFKRFFWPPKLLFKVKKNYPAQNKMFRTRGTYMDFPEVIADWPKPLDVNFEKTDRELLSNVDVIFQLETEIEALKKAEEEMQQKEKDQEALVIELSEPPQDDKTKRRINIGQGKDYNWDDWYYDDAIGEFFRKKVGFMVDYYMDGKNNCWRLKRPQKNNLGRREPTPYDWYFDLQTGTFLARDDYLGLDEFVYDDNNGVYKLRPAQPLVPTAVNKVRKSTQKKKSGEQKSKFDSKIEGYYFDEEEGKWLLKDGVPEKKFNEIVWDENGFRYARKVEGEWRGLTGLSPDDYFFDDKMGRFNPKPPRQGKYFKYHEKDGVWRKASASAPDKMSRVVGNTPTNFYFDEFEGQFKLKDVPPTGKYRLQKYAHIWRKNPEPRSGMHPERFYWDNNKKLWLPRVVRMEMIHNAQTAKNEWTAEITRGSRNGLDLEATQPDAFFWDIEEGKFLVKTKHAKYYLDNDGFWKSVKLRDKMRNRIYPFDFFYDYKINDFVRKDKNNNTYIFNNKVNVWTTKDAPEEFECAFSFDVEQEKWTPKGPSNEGYIDIGIFVKPHQDTNIKIPSDYWFHEKEGRFLPKTPEDANEYYYNYNEGAWKKKGVTKSNAKGLNPRNFYFDDNANRYKLKVDGQKKDYWYDKNNKIFRHVAGSGDTRSGYQPTDFYWNSDLKLFVLDKTYGKLRGKITSDLPKWDPMRRYKKGWLPSEDQSVATASTVIVKAKGKSFK